MHLIVMYCKQLGATDTYKKTNLFTLHRQYTEGLIKNRHANPEWTKFIVVSALISLAKSELD